MSLRSKVKTKLQQHKDEKGVFHLRRLQTQLSDEFFDVNDDEDILSVSGINPKTANTGTRSEKESRKSSTFVIKVEKEIFEEHLAQLQEQLVSAMIENKAMADELTKYKKANVVETLWEELSALQKRNRELEAALNTRGQSSADRSVSRRRPDIPTVDFNENVDNDTDTRQTSGRLQRVRDWMVDWLYTSLEEFSDLTQPVELKPQPTQPLNLKILKANVGRFQLAIKPYVDTVRGIQNLMLWNSKSYTFLVLCLLLFVCRSGWLIPLMLFLAALKMIVNYLNFRGYPWYFSYFPVDEEDKEDADTLGLSEKINIVIMVATKVQNGLATAADGLEKIQNLLTWRHKNGAKRVFKMLCMGFVFSILLPTPVLWKLIGITMVIKMFVVKKIYSMFPRFQQRFDSTHRLWLELPTNAQYSRIHSRAEMDKFISVSPNARGELETSIVNAESDAEFHASDDFTDDQDRFRELFSLPVSEQPLKGWENGKRAVLISKNRSLVSTLAKKRGKLFLTKSFLCFERDHSPSVRNIVVPIRDVVQITKIKVNERLPGKGMSIQLDICTDGTSSVLRFGGILRREDMVKDIEHCIQSAKQNEAQSGDRVSRKTSDWSSTDHVTNFTFGAYYEDSE
ncbi:GRAM domain-containing protein 4-like isoform X2 [Dreissena polymorpha]|uniref:GRAM domain-containing protein 4-like isoform X2 n=1 Tax=Dreissena polymorpha TaxID=45954 RepID=UPI002263E1BC|nr:GRAM domain-containing protein 4-like isoform X2 [Dreissena polymorpha]